MQMLLDSVILIDHFNGIDKATDFIEQHQKNLSLSMITRIEVLVGFTNHEATSVRILLNSFPTLPITTEDADLAAELRRVYRWKLPDALQAALAKRHKCKLVTRNTKDFNPKHQHFVLIPYK